MTAPETYTVRLPVGYTVRLPVGTMPPTVEEAVAWCREHAPSADTSAAERVLDFLSRNTSSMRIRIRAGSFPVAFTFGSLSEAVHFKLRFY